MSQTANINQHDLYAADYDDQVLSYDCHMAEILFGLCYEYVMPDQLLLDVGIGTGISAQLFARAGLQVYGMDFSTAMLEICQAKGFAIELKQQDILQTPWPYPDNRFNHLVCCGVLHFASNLEVVLSEAQRVLWDDGMFAFTTRTVPFRNTYQLKYVLMNRDGMVIYSHTRDYLESLLSAHSFKRIKIQKCFVGDDIFTLWVVQKHP